MNILDFVCNPSTLTALLSFRGGGTRPSRWRKYINAYSNFKGVAWNEEELAYIAPSLLQCSMLYVQLLCWPLVLIGWPFIMVSLFSLGWSNVNIIGYIAFFFFSGGVIVHQLMFKGCYQEYRGLKELSLNRRTGLVTLYDRGEEVFCHRFMDFNCYFKQEYYVGRTGWVRHLYLAYRKEDYPYDHIVDLTRFVGSKASLDYLEVWRIIKCYMNISLPLPESLFQASRRPFDPTTAAYDSEHENSPVVSISMSDSEFEHLISTSVSDDEFKRMIRKRDKAEADLPYLW